MRRLSAHFIITNNGPPLMKGIITTGDDGTVLNLEDTGGLLKESRSVEFHNGIIIPGFVNCHCHLELSHLKGAISRGTGLGGFLIQLQDIRKKEPEAIISSASSADIDMYAEGVQLCVDICNNSLTFSIKKNSRINYHNLIEVFAIDPADAENRIQESLKLAGDCEKYGLPFSLVPHTVYAVSLPLFRMIRERTLKNRITSIHFMETEGEESFVSDHSGPLMEAFKKAGILPHELITPADCVSAILEEVTPSGSLILVHNTYAGRETVKRINTRGNVFWCLCPNANLYIENRIPPATMFREEGCDIVIGTDSLASNERLSILSELKTLQKNFPSLTLEDLIRWATINGAKALGEDGKYGIIETGKKPGLLLLENADLIDLKLIPETSVRRLI